MGILVNDFQPKDMHLIVAPGKGKGATMWIIPAPSDARVTARIDRDPFRVFSVAHMSRYALQDVLSDEVPAGHRPLKVKEWVEQQRSDGSAPLDVAQGESVEVEVAFLAPSSHSSLPFTGVLLVESDVWDVVRVPLTLTLGEVHTTLPSTPVHLTQGRDTDVPITIELVVGPDTAVRYELSRGQLDTGLSMSSTTFHLKRGDAPRQESLRLTAARNARSGVETQFIDALSFDLDSLVLPVVIGHAPVNVSPPGQPPLVVEQGSHFPIPVTVDLAAGNSTQVLLTPSGAPRGVSIAPMGALVRGKDTMQMSGAATDDAPLVRNFVVRVDWSAYNGEQTGFIGVEMDVSPAVADFREGNPPLTDGRIVCSDRAATLSSDGRWSFVGRVRNTGTVFPVRFAMAAFSNFRLGNGGAWVALRVGTLGGIQSPPHVDFQTGRFEDAFISAFLHQNWRQVFLRGVSFRLLATPDLSVSSAALALSIMTLIPAPRPGPAGVFAEDDDGSIVGFGSS